MGQRQTVSTFCAEEGPALDDVGIHDPASIGVTVRREGRRRDATSVVEIGVFTGPKRRKKTR